MITEYVASLINPQASYAPYSDFWYSDHPGLVTQSCVAVDTDTAMRVGAFFNAIRILAETVAQPPLIFYERMGEDEKRVAREHPLYNVLHNRPNAYQTSYEFRNVQTVNMLLGGNSYSEQLGEGRSPVEELRPLIPGYMQRPKVLASGRVGYMYHEPNKGETPYTQDEIFHVRAFPITTDGVAGQSILTFMRECLGLAISTERYGSRLFTDDAKQRGNYSVPGTLTKEQMDRLRENIKGADGLMILQNGATWVQTGMTAQDAEFLLTRKFQVIDIARFLNVQPHLLKDLERATFSNIEHQSLEFLQFTMMPYFVNWEQAILRDLIVQKNRFFAEFLVDGIVRADIQTRYGAYSTAINTGFMTRNQARQKENWNRIEGLDAPLVDQNKALVDKRGNIVPINKPEAPRPAEQPMSPEREREAAHYNRLLTGSAERVMRKEAAAMGKAWEKDHKDPDKLRAWAAKFYGEHAHFVSEVMQIDGEKAEKFAEDRREQFILTVNDKKTSVLDHLHYTEKYGPEQLIKFLQNGKAEHGDEREI